MRTLYKKPGTVGDRWHVVDASGRSLGDVATHVASLVRGKRQVFFSPHWHMGDYVVVVNVEKVVMTGQKSDKKFYYNHSGYPGGMKRYTYREMCSRRVDAPLRRAVKGMLPRGPLGNRLLKAVKMYAGDRHPHAAQRPVEYKW